MSRPFIEFRLEYNHVGRIARELSDKVDAVVDKTAFDIQAEAQQNITELGAIDTGSMKASAYASTPKSSSYGAAAAEARGLNPNAVIQSEERPGEHEAIVGIAVEHGIYNELGTVRMPPRPFLGPAFEAMRRPFRQALRKVLG